MNIQSRVSSLRAARNSAIVSFSKFISEYPKSPDTVFCFFEAEDDVLFFRQWLEPVFEPNPIKCMPCSGKDGVLHNFVKISKRNIDNSRVLYFVDKDLDDYLKVSCVESNIFVTKFYSIENYLVSDAVFVRSLIDFVKLDEDHPSLKTIVPEFLLGLDRFKKISLPLIAYIIAAQKIGHQFRLSELKYSEIFSFSVEGSKFVVKSKRNRCDKLLHICETSASDQPKLSDVISVARSLRKEGVYKLWLRGKWEMNFFVKVINSIPDVLNQGRIKGDPKYKLRINLTESNSIISLSPRCRIPTDIDSFIRDAQANRNAAV